ncbi:hypothetical protein CYMTET_52940 [Cymbomonas tetramitiformis]|uniref:Calcineurin-like phosphoesterase domain-containing protein n=1 Tax=Cymbomonas tetramitiformis TaxID=36881 RepID=A0AAE0EQU7_9CHLO|nr:hypothetical protein CYMTET_52940 [Cymbomonas tetramitiformis]
MSSLGSLGQVKLIRYLQLAVTKKLRPPLACKGLEATARKASSLTYCGISGKAVPRNYSGKKNGGLKPPKIETLDVGDVCSDGRIIVIGDVHGCCGELLDLLEKCDRRTQDLVIFVGDLVNKGPDSARVLAEARRIGALAVLGNHDAAALQAYEKWLANPSIALAPKYQWVEELCPEDVAWLRACPLSLAIPFHDALVVHAGLVPGLPLKKQSRKNMYKIRDVVPDGSGWAAVKKGGLGPPGRAFPWASRWQGPQHIIFGHDARRLLQRYTYATGLDTACVYGGELTACILPSVNDLRTSGMRSDPAMWQFVAVKACDVYQEPIEPVIHGKRQQEGMQSWLWEL